MLRRFIYCLVLIITALPYLGAQDADERDPSYAEFRDFLPVTSARHIPPSKARKFTLEIGYADLREKPPGKEFMVEMLPPKVVREAVLSKVSSMESYKASRTTINLVDKDPDGNPLKSPFALGEVIHYAVTGETEDGITFTYYYYYCDDVEWYPSEDGKSWQYGLNKHEHFRNLTLKPGMWYLIAGPERMYTTVEHSEKVTFPLYTYYLIRIMHTN